MKKLILTVLSLTFIIPIFATAEPLTAQDVYRRYCAICHGAKRYGDYAPPLIPEFLKRQKDHVLKRVIAKGLPSTQMPPFEQMLTDEEINSVITYIRQPAHNVKWTEADIKKSRVLFPPKTSQIPVSLEREKVILVVERGTRQIVVFNGQTMKELDRYDVGKIHGGPKFDGKYEHVYVVTRDGLLTGYNLKKGFLTVKGNIAVNTRNIAVSPDGKFLAVANLLPQNLTVFDPKLNVLRVFPLPGKPSGVYQLPRSNSFILALRDTPKLYLLEYPQLKLKEITLKYPFEDFMFVPGENKLFASSRKHRSIYLYNLDSLTLEKTLSIDGFPHLFSATFFKEKGKLFAALNHMHLPQLSIIDMQNLTIEKKIKLKGAGYFVRTHPQSPYLWVDTNTEEIQLIEKKSLRLLKRTIHPVKGKKAMHIEFDYSGKQALISVWDKEGYVVIYDSRTLKETKRIPFDMPIGKYNAFNKTHFPL
jgi:DNA-binding beta-propeller fold protein YncE/cytochrome c553